MKHNIMRRAVQIAGVALIIAALYFVYMALTFTPKDYAPGDTREDYNYKGPLLLLCMYAFFGVSGVAIIIFAPKKRLKYGKQEI